MTNSKHSRIQLWFGIPSWAARAMTLKEVCLIVTKSSILSWNMNKIHGVIRHRRHVTGLSSVLLLVFASEDMHLAPDGIHFLLQENTAILLFLPLLLSRLFAFAFITPGLSCAGWRGTTLYLLCRENSMGNKPSTIADTAWTATVWSISQTKRLSIMQTSRIQVGVFGIPTPGPPQNCVLTEN